MLTKINKKFLNLLLKNYNKYVISLILKILKKLFIIILKIEKNFIC